MKLIKRFSAAIFAALLFAPMAMAQPIGNVIAGYDYTNSRAKVPNVDSSGRMAVFGAAAGGSVYGNDAIGAAGTQPPVRIGGSSGNTTGSTINAWNVDGNGRGLIQGAFSTGSTAASVNGLMVGGSDGTNYRHLATSNTGVLNVIGSMTSGTSTNSVHVAVGGWDGTNNRVLATDANGFLKVTGGINSGAADGGGPVKVGGKYNATGPSFSDGQRGDLQLDANGDVFVALTGKATTGADGVSNSLAYVQTAARASALLPNATYVYNGSTWDMQRGLVGASPTNPLGVVATQTVPTNSGNAAIAPVISSALESGHVLKASAGNLYRLRVTATSAGYILVFNSTTVPADGAVTPQSCTYAAAAGTTEIDHVIPDRFATGISVAFSTTGCFTKTASAVAMIEGSVQ